MCMGAADIVPGISGGTIAFIMGFYEQLINSIKRLDRAALKFLAPLILGIVCSLLLLASFFDFILGHPVYRVYLYASFLGLILASTYFCFKKVKHWSFACLGGLSIGMLSAYLLTSNDLQIKSSEPLYAVQLSDVYQPSQPLINYDPASGKLLDVPESTVAAMLAKGIISHSTPLYNAAGELQKAPRPHTGTKVDGLLVLCGAIAISAMLLPGVSGSYLLTILGVYPLIIGALADFSEGLKRLQFEQDAFMVLLSTGFGILIGAIAFSRVVSWMMRHYHDLTVATLIGFMLGALQSVWPFWSYAYALSPLKLHKGAKLLVLNPVLPDLGNSLFWLAILFSIIGFSSVLLVERLGKRLSI